MLTIHTESRSFSRRGFLRVGAMGFGGLTLADVLRCKASGPGGFLKDKSVVWLWLGGGPPQHETFDPKMDAPSEIGTMFGEVKTTLPGVRFGSHFPKLAQRMHKLAVVRSFQTPCQDHQSNWVRKFLSGADEKLDEPGVGSIYSYLRGTNHPVTGVPTYVLLDSGQNKEFLQEHFLKGNSAGNLPQSYAPFNPAGVVAVPGTKRKQGKGGKDEDAPFSPIFDDMQVHLPLEHLANRRELLRGLDTLNRRMDAQGHLESFDRYREQAFSVLRGSVTEAFQLDKEDPKTIASYDTSHIRVTCPNFDRSMNFPRKPSLLGRQMLLARRLCEAGAGFVMVENCGWDFHSNDLNPGMVAGMNGHGPQLDHAVAAFLDDVQERGLSEKILLVICGEMGRTPKINPEGGRDHWPQLAPLVLAGGGLKMGQVVGVSDRHGAKPATTPYTPAHLSTTILQTLFDVGQLRLETGLRPELMRRVDAGEPIRELI